MSFWDNRALLTAFVVRDFRTRYVGNLGGLSWVLIHPLLLLGLYSVLFRTIFKVKLPESYDFIEFLALALWPWMAFQEAVLRGAQAVRNHASLVKKIAFPHQIMVLSAVISSFLVHTLGFYLVLILLALYGNGLDLSGLGMAMMGLVGLFMLAVAASLFLASLQVFVPDLEHFLSQLMLVIFYSTPILYPLSMVPDWLQPTLAWNPVAIMIDLIRSGLLVDEAVTHKMGIIVFWALLPFLLYASNKFFSRLSPHFEDYL